MKRWKPVVSEGMPPAFAYLGAPGALTSEGSRGLRWGLHNKTFALKLAQIATLFEHLEDETSVFLSRLANCEPDTALFLYRAIKSPRARKEVLEALLHRALQNAECGSQYDEVIREFWACANLRNKYVHGRWWTGTDKTKRVFFAPATDDGKEMGKALPASVVHMDWVIHRIQRAHQLTMLVSRSKPIPDEELKHHLPLAPEPSARTPGRKTRTSASRRRKTRAAK